MGLHRPYIRDSVREEVENRAPKNEEGQFLDANTGEPIEGQYDLGHKAGHEHWREAENAEKEGLTQPEFNDRMNNPDYYQIEDPSENRSHKHEMKDAAVQGVEPEQNTEPEQSATPERDSDLKHDTAPKQNTTPAQTTAPSESIGQSADSGQSTDGGYDYSGYGY